MASAAVARRQPKRWTLPVTQTAETLDSAKAKRDLADALDGTYSSLREKMLEHAFLTELARALWRSGRRDFEFLRAEVDRGGYDVAVECGGVLRHIQLKSRHRAGKATEVSLALALADKPSGCAVWIDYDPLTLDIGPFLWFGGAPGEKLPALGDKVTRHSKGNKQERPAHRTIKRSGFKTIETMDALAVTLFGPVARRRHWADRLDDLASLAAAFRSVMDSPDAAADADAELVLGSPSESGGGVILGMPHFELGSLLARFVDLANTDWAVDADALAAARVETQRLQAEPALISTATENDLAALITALVREDRINEGRLAEAMRQGLLTQIAERAGGLAAEGGQPEPSGAKSVSDDLAGEKAGSEDLDG